DRRRAPNFLAVRSIARVQEAIAPGNREVTVSEEATAEMQPFADLLTPLVGIGRDGDDLDAGLLGLGQVSSKTLELRHAERSPVAAVEDDHDGLLAAVLRERYVPAGRIGQREIRRPLADSQHRRGGGNTPGDEVEPRSA